MTYTIKDRNGQDYEIQDIERFANHISKNHSSGVSQRGLSDPQLLQGMA